MESLLGRLFEYQRFEGNAALAAVVDEVHARFGLRELQTEEMEYVSAAGVPEESIKNPGMKKTEEEKR